MLKHKRLILSLFFIYVTLFSAMHTAVENHSHSSCPICVINDHSSAILHFDEIILDSNLHQELTVLYVSQRVWLVAYILPHANAPPLS